MRFIIQNEKLGYKQAGSPKGFVTKADLDDFEAR